MRRGGKLAYINTKELIRLYESERRKTITDIPHQGITYISFNTSCKNAKKWEIYITHTCNTKTSLENIPPEVGKRFAIWLKESDKDRYKDRERSNETINHFVAAVKKMYREIAIEEKHIIMAEFPVMHYLKVNRETKPKRDMLEAEEFTNLRKWMTNIWCGEKDIDNLERLKRKMYVLYLIIQYYGGFRNKEILGIR